MIRTHLKESHKTVGSFSCRLEHPLKNKAKKNKQNKTKTKVRKLKIDKEKKYEVDIRHQPVMIVRFAGTWRIHYNVTHYITNVKVSNALNYTIHIKKRYTSYIQH
jgi:hypothetical protein